MTEELYADHMDQVFRVEREGSLGTPVAHLQDGHSSRSGWFAFDALKEKMENLNVRNLFCISHSTTWSQTNDRGFVSFNLLNAAFLF